MTKSFNFVVPILLTVTALVFVTVSTPTDFMLAVCYVALFCAHVPSPSSCP
jgi:hypothetical protein